jgi:hypothetical protein
MKHLKRFNESIDNEIKNEIEQAVKDCFLDYITDYVMTIEFEDGFYVPGYNFMTERFLKDLIRKYPDKTQKLQGKNDKCIKVDFYNEGLGDGSRLNIYLDENSQDIFNEAIHNLKSELKMITNSFRLEGVPEKLSPDFFSIKFLIIYE